MNARPDPCVRCGHERADHGQERGFFYVDSKREVCLMCDGYEYEDGSTGYPHGKAWHRFKPAAAAVEEMRGRGMTQEPTRDYATEGNARLITAAPDLLAAARDVIAQYERGEHYLAHLTELADAIRALKAAVRAGEGGGG